MDFMSDKNFRQLAEIIPAVSHETFADLCAYESLLRKWQPHINLIANSTVNNIWQRHILDSAQLYPLASDARNWLDLGSGGGFPAIVIACLLKQRNEENSSVAHIDLVESNGKKTVFLRQVIEALNLPASVHQERIEHILPALPAPQVITARALASLDNLCSYIAPLALKAEGRAPIALLQKGRLYEQEIAEAKQHWQFDTEIIPSRIDDDSVILLLRNVRVSANNFAA